MLELYNLQMEDLLKKYYETTNEKIVFVNKEGKIVVMNDAAEEVISKDNSYSVMTNAICDRHEGYLNEFELQSCKDCYLGTSKPNDINSQVFTRTVDRKVRSFIASYQATNEDNKIYVFTLQDISSQIERQEKMYQRQMMRKTVSVQGNERKRISRELYDSVIREMLNIDVELRLLKYQEESPELVQQLQRTEGLMSKLINDIRHLSVKLRPSPLDDLGSEAALKSYFKQSRNNHGMQVVYQSNIKDKRYDSEVETVVYRVVQEAVLNVLEYVGVSSVDVSVQEVGRLLMAEVTDHGQGFDPNSQPQGIGLGLYGMNERVELVNGKVNVETHLGKGTIITLEVPL